MGVLNLLCESVNLHVYYRFNKKACIFKLFK